MRALRWLTVSVAILSFVACDNADAARDPVWHKQPCAHCHMVLSDPHHAAQLVTQDAERLYFDDVGCLASYMLEHKPALGHVWVQDGGHWKDARMARYRSGAQTPMGFGFETVANGEIAFDAIQRAVAERAAQVTPP